VKPILTHRTLALWVSLPLVISALSGVLYRVGRAWFDIPKGSWGWLMDLHTGAWLGRWGSVIYLSLAAIGLLIMAGSGAAMLLKRGSKMPARRRHRLLGMTLLLPLVATAITGISYKIGIEFFGLSDSMQSLLMDIHQGSWMGHAAAPFNVLLVGSGLLILILSGLRIGPWWRKKNHSAVG